MNALSFIETKESDVASKSADASFLMKQKNCTYSPSSHSGKVQSERVLMGIMHSSRPHYGVQVCCMIIAIVNAVALLSLCNTLDFMFSPFSSIQRVLLLAMEGRYSRILERSQRIIG